MIATQKASADRASEREGEARRSTHLADLGIIRYFTTYDAGQTRSAIALLALAGVLEGFGFAAILPLLDAMLGSESAAPSALSGWIAGALAVVGLTPSLGTVLGALVVVFWLKAAIIITAMIRVGILTARVTLQLRLRLLRAVVRAEWRHAQRYPTGFISNAVSREADITANTFREFCTMTAEILQVAAYLLVAALISWQTASVAVITGAVVMTVLRRHLSSVRRSGVDQTSLLRSVSARIADALPSLKPLKAMGREGYLLPFLERELHAFFDASRRLEISKEMLNRGREPMVVLVLSTGLWGILTFSSLSSTEVVVLALLFYRTVTTLTNVQVRWATVRHGESAFTSIKEHIDTLEAVAEREDSSQLPTVSLRESLEFDSVSFAYEDDLILRSVSAKLHRGRFVTLTGSSGSGKSTMTDLITGLLRPTEGRILVDGVDLRSASTFEWRRTIGYVPQDSMLFSDTIRQNVTLGEIALGDDDVRKALVDAGAWEFVSRLPGGLTHRIGEGGTALSGGQKQRLAIARAIVRRPQLLILDEPTASLDSVSEREVCATIAALRGHLTILAVSHQPALQEIADEVWILSEGRLRASQEPRDG